MRKYIESGLEPPAYGPREPRATKVAPFERYLRERLTAFPDLTGRRLLREIHEHGYGGGYIVLKDSLREIRPPKTTTFEVRFETPAGRQAQVDFSHFRTVFTDEPSTERVVWLFSLVLGHSRMLWARFVVRRICKPFCAAMPRPLRRLAARRSRSSTIGCARCSAAKIQREATLSITEPWSSLPVITAIFQKPVSRIGPRRRARSAPFRYIREDFFLGRSFRNLDDLNVQFRDWLDQVANVRTHATTRRVVAEHFAEEAPTLQPLVNGARNFLRSGGVKFPSFGAMPTRSGYEDLFLGGRPRRRGASAALPETGLICRASGMRSV